MCYPKPGPRCSPHAAAKAARAQHAVLIYLEEHSGDDWDGFERISGVLKAARDEYNITPAGIKKLERLAAEHPDEMGYQLEVDKARAERTRRINALRADQRFETKHRKPKAVTAAYSTTDFTDDGGQLAAFNLRHPDVKTLLDESAAWTANLTPDEIATARWYSEGGYKDINGGLMGNPRTFGSVPSPTDYRPAVKHLDAAIAKATRETPIITYRRHFFYNNTDKMLTMSAAEQQAQFPVGSIYKPGFYMSTSIDPANARQGNIVAALQIKARRGAPLPAVANQGIGETEILLPRDGAYRVIANDRTVTITEKDGSDYTIPIIQLEEI